MTIMNKADIEKKEETEEKQEKKPVLIKPFCREKVKTGRLKFVLENCMGEYSFDKIATVEEFEEYDFSGRRIIFAVAVGESGVNLEWYAILKKIRRTKECFKGCVGGIIVDGSSELYTKSFARELVLSANLAGCTFVGKPLVEGTGSLKNFNVVAKNLSVDNLEAYAESSRELVKRVMEFKICKKEKPSLLVLHAGNEKSSNSLALWHETEKIIGDRCSIKTISLRNGQIWDCIGCPYDACLHFGEQGKCFYGGVIPEQVYPAILEADALLLVCANYNDAISANIAAFINRLTALFRTRRFFDKALFAIVVSGYSGSDIVAQQLISSINMNKTFYLPSEFVLMETANNPKEVLDNEDVFRHINSFADNIMEFLCK